MVTSLRSCTWFSARERVVREAGKQSGTLNTVDRSSLIHSRRVTREKWTTFSGVLLHCHAEEESVIRDENQ